MILFHNVVQVLTLSYLNAPIVQQIKAIDTGFVGTAFVNIDQAWLTVLLGADEDDPREDPRIVEALKKYGQFRHGLQCEILSFWYNEVEGVILELELRLQQRSNLRHRSIQPVHVVLSRPSPWRQPQRQLPSIRKRQIPRPATRKRPSRPPSRTS